MAHDQHQEVTMEHEHHQEVKEAHFEAARNILVDGAQEEDQKQSYAAWRHIMEAMKQQKMTDRIDRKEARVKKKESKKNQDRNPRHWHNDPEKNRSSSSGDSTSKTPAVTKKEEVQAEVIRPFGNCNGTYCDMCDCAQCKNVTCEKWQKHRKISITGSST